MPPVACMDAAKSGRDAVARSHRSRRSSPHGLQWVHSGRPSPRRSHPFNGSTARSPWYGGLAQAKLPVAQRTSMGPRLARRGMVKSNGPLAPAASWLQWVHGSLAVVWIRLAPARRPRRSCFNGSTARSPWYGGLAQAKLPVARRFNGSTARSPWYGEVERPLGPGGVLASMGPRLARRGMRSGWHRQDARGVPASMGPRLARRGMGGSRDHAVRAAGSFNGSTARSPWYGGKRPQVQRMALTLQWVHGSLAVVWDPGLHPSCQCSMKASMGPRLARRGMDLHQTEDTQYQPASMGPRLARRGMVPAGVPPAPALVGASMGPRLARRGMGL